MSNQAEKMSPLAQIRTAATAVLAHAAAGNSAADAEAFQAHLDLGNNAETIMKVMAERECLLETLTQVLASAWNMYLHFQPNMTKSDQSTRYKLLQDGDTTVMLIEGEHLTGSGSRHYVIHTVGDVDPVLHGPYLTTQIRDGVAGLIRLDNDEDGVFMADIDPAGALQISPYSGRQMEHLMVDAAAALPLDKPAG